ncbi:MurR/RpiR family transcriptional regulator [Lacticaseibacillus daqingensis]|uniref:MurR/RpiR family transcriptional regulator n=1 Tax=Lacticaseibacillus daqingensis TaxID=2486014 RepID=UPI000F77A6B1|nr:MurR/RpiR family transcriptional regulator [Lacticaseibacillus daqingensis]
MAAFAVQLLANRQQLSTKEQALGDYLLQHAKRASTQSISALAEATGVSVATVSRFAKAIGYPNFQALRVALAQTATAPMFGEIEAHDDTLTVARKLFALNVDALTATESGLDATTLDAAVRLITHAHTLGLFGLGASNLVAQDGYHKFLRTPIQVSYTTDYHMQLMAATRLTAADAAIIISHTGTDKDALALAKVLHAAAVPLIVITGSPRSPLAKLATVLLVALAEETQYRAEALHALIAQIALMDTLFVLAAIATDSASEAILARIRTTIQQTRE